jgi:hypothetical protein
MLRESDTHFLGRSQAWWQRRAPATSIVMAAVAAWALLMPPLDAQPRAGSFTTVTLTDTTANALLVGCAVGSTTCTGGIKSGGLSVNGVGVVGSDGRIPAISSTYFANLSGTNLTGIATLAGNHNISGTYTIDNNVSLQSRNSAASAMNLAMVTSGNLVLFGPTAAQVVAGVGVDTSITASGTISFLTGNPLNTFTTLSNVGTWTHGGARAFTATITPSALANGNNNNYNPTGLSTTSMVILTADAGGSTITGLTAQANGTELDLCEPTPGAGSLTIANESASSTAANRFNLGSGGNITLNKDTSGGVAGPCVTVKYYGAASRWLLKSTSTSVP